MTNVESAPTGQPEIVVWIDTPADGSVVPVVPRIAHLTGRIAANSSALASASVTVKLGDADTATRGATLLPPPRSGQWTYDGPLPADVPDGAQLRISATGEGDVWNSTHTDTVAAQPGTATVGVTLDKPAIRLGDVVYAKVAEPSSVPYHATVTGTTAGAAAGVTAVSYRFDKIPTGGGPAGTATNGSGDWRTWTIDVELADYGDYTLTIVAEATGQRSDQFTGTLAVHRPFGVGDPALAFAPTTYVGELCNFAQDFLAIEGQPHGPDRAGLTARFRQSYDRIPDPAAHAVAAEQVPRARVMVEVLRRYLQAPPPPELDQRYRAAAYEALLAELGTSSDELRRVRLDPAKAQALAARVGVEPARLPLLTFSPDAVTGRSPGRTRTSSP